uniref:Cadherin domain-containing protein n=1 Tax=Varanus komodoensis TaxID=61221 RepID=A0A8D2JEU7_VARKO
MDRWEGEDGRALARQVLLLSLLPLSCWAASEQVRYSIPEEMEKGSVVGSLAKDLGLNARELAKRNLHAVPVTKLQYFSISGENGNLCVNERIDREEICATAPHCLVTLEVMVENPLDIFHVTVAIEDINDNAPQFFNGNINLETSEVTSPGTRFLLGKADDPDIGMNSVQDYQLSPNQYFTLDVKKSQDANTFADLVLQKPLDRESEQTLHLILTALDGGEPRKTGTAQIWINVTDANDNPPIFSQEVYTVNLRENAPVGSQVLQLVATDNDDGSYAQIRYHFSNIPANAQQNFRIDPISGTITLMGDLDYEETKAYAMTVAAKDGGGLVTHVKVEIKILDENDNYPEVILTSLFSPVPEDSLPGTLIALINVNDKDAGDSGKVACSLRQDLPFKIIRMSNNYYKLLSDGPLDRERTPEYNITVTASDTGSPPLSTYKSILLQVSDVNDNAPAFERPSYSIYVPENNPSGTSVFRVSASDPDMGQNARITYSILTSTIQELPLDHEEEKVHHLILTAYDGGSPVRSGTTEIQISVLDVNDNAPIFSQPLYEVTAREGLSLGTTVVTLNATDLDEGTNRDLRYSFAKSTGSAAEKFHLDENTGEVTLRGKARPFLEKDALRQSLVVLLKDNGQPPLSASVTVTVVLADSIPEVLSDLGGISAPADAQPDLTFYLVLAVAFVSCLFFAFLLVLLALNVHKWRHSRLQDCGNMTSNGVPAPPFVGLDTVRAVLHSYCHEVCLTADSRHSHFHLPKGCSCSTFSKMAHKISCSHFVQSTGGLCGD